VFDLGRSKEYPGRGLSNMLKSRFADLGLADILSQVQGDDIKVIQAGSPPIQASTALIRFSCPAFLLILMDVHAHRLLSGQFDRSRALKMRAYMLRDIIAISCF
jgi:hypothetical protein